jgi:hypothetical protein
MIFPYHLRILHPSRFDEMLYRKNRNNKGWLSRLPRAGYSTAERITTQTNQVSFPSAKNLFFADGT